MDNLKHIRNSVNKKDKNLRRRLNRWNFRKLQECSKIREKSSVHKEEGGGAFW
ncbi:MAG TPA: hypothetical protein EYP21_03260 [Syntrophaceae bacterium]|nr:hypothetical protein [Syntrophaceae bacterium]